MSTGMPRNGDFDICIRPPNKSRILLYPSFTPFLVVFTHAVTTSNDEELSLLEETVRSLDHVKGISPGVHRLYDICKSFSDAAKVLINSRRTLGGLRQDDHGSLLFSSTNAQAGQYQSVTNSGFSWPAESQNAEAMSAIFNNWIEDNQPAGDVFGLLPSEMGFY